MKLLHIIVHMGGGVGRAVTEVVTNERDDYQHQILCLEQPVNEQFILKCRQSGIQIVWGLSEAQTVHMAQEADIIILHWWHHPIMIQFLNRISTIKLKIVIWSHINGCFYPFIPYKFLDMHDTFFVTSEYTLENPEWQIWQCLEARKKAFLVYGMGKFDKIPEKKCYLQQGEIKVGFCGTLSLCKIHSDYVAACEQIIKEIPNIKFQLFGSLESESWLYTEIKRRHLEQYFQFMGYSKEVTSELQGLDIFGYPLNPEHFGTTENVILEAMAAGLPVILLNQNTERFIIKDGINGILAKDMETYVQSIIFLAKNADYREYLGKNARNHVSRFYSLDDNLERFYDGIEHAKSCIPKVINYVGYFEGSPHQWFLKGMNDTWKKSFLKAVEEAEEGRFEILKYFIAKHPILKEKTKSSVLHFANYFPDVLVLQQWKKYIEMFDMEEVE